MDALYPDPEPTREQVDAMRGPAVLELGAPWCGYCQRARPIIAAALAAHAAIPHLKVEDAPGRALGRSFGIKLWPTLLFLYDGAEVARVTRPQRAEDITAALRQLETRQTHMQR